MTGRTYSATSIHEQQQLPGNHGGTISVQDMQTLISAIQDNNSAIASQALTFTQSMIDSKNKGDNYLKDLNLQDAFDSKKEHFATWQAPW